MILYKYVPFDAGQKILETRTLGFSLSNHLNDPFDTPRYPRESGDRRLFDIKERIHVMANERAWSEKSGILSLTRTPTNPLMWAHYADKHRGMVIGIDVIAAGLTDESSNLIPAQYGSVVYTSHQPTSPFIGSTGADLRVAETHHFPHEHYEKLQRLFLHKPLYWSYEEEVRVVKCLQSLGPTGGETLSGKFNVATIDQHPLHLLSIPPEALREVYFGFKLDVEQADDFYYRAKASLPHLRIFECELQLADSSVKAVDYTTIAEGVAG